MVLFARNLADMAELLGKRNDAAGYRREANALAVLINQRMWDPARQFYFDLMLDGTPAPTKTSAAFWTLISELAGPEQARAMVAQLNDPATFKRLHRIPTVPADEPGYDGTGGYWRGAVWSAMNTMVIRGLERNGYRELAREIALNDLEVMGRVFQETGTIWENYAPDAVQPGKPAHADFVGFSGVSPILYLLEFGVGLKPDAAKKPLTWDIRSMQTVGCERYRFNAHVVSLTARPTEAESRRLKVAVESSGCFTLIVQWSGQQKSFEITPGKREFVMAAD